MIWSTLTVSRSRRLHGRVEWRKKWVKRGREGEEGVRLGESVLRTEEGKKKVGFLFLTPNKTVVTHRELVFDGVNNSFIFTL